MQWLWCGNWETRHERWIPGEQSGELSVARFGTPAVELTGLAGWSKYACAAQHLRSFPVMVNYCSRCVIRQGAPCSPGAVYLQFYSPHALVVKLIRSRVTAVLTVLKNSAEIYEQEVDKY